MSPVRTTCAYCGVGCGIVARKTGERSLEIKGDPDHPANFGRLCSKGTHLGETVGLEGRLLAPMIGQRQADWDEALDLVTQRLRTCIDQHGPDSVAFYVSGQLLTEDYYVANKLMKGFIGSGNIDTNSRLCMASAVAAHNRAFGEDLVPCTYDDLDAADLILLVGSNTAWCHPVIWQRIEAARAGRGTKIVVIDPRRTETAEQADLHVALAPDGDVALFNALLGEMAARGLAEADVAPCDPGIEPATFAALADLVAAHPRMVTLFSQGANQSRYGTDKGNAVINLHLATGRINAPGMGPFSITGQPNAMGGREVGGLANMLACHLGFSEAERADVAGFWRTERLCTGPGLKAVDMFRAVHDGRDQVPLGDGDQPRRIDARRRLRPRGAGAVRDAGGFRGDRRHRHRAPRPRPPARARLGRERRHGDQLGAPDQPPARAVARARRGAGRLGDRRRRRPAARPRCGISPGTRWPGCSANMPR